MKKTGKRTWKKLATPIKFNSSYLARLKKRPFEKRKLGENNWATPGRWFSSYLARLKTSRVLKEAILFEVWRGFYFRQNSTETIFDCHKLEFVNLFFQFIYEMLCSLLDKVWAEVENHKLLPGKTVHWLKKSLLLLLVSLTTETASV